MNQKILTVGKELSQHKFVKSIVYYPHPFSLGGFVNIVNDKGVDWLQALSTIYRIVPQEYNLHCIREHELFQLGIPGLFSPPIQINERTHFAAWLKHKGIVLHGADFRSRIKLDNAPKMLLAGHIEGCMDYLRRYGILTLLAKENYQKLIALLITEMEQLMGTALLLKDIWDIEPNDLHSQFFAVFDDVKLKQLSARLQTIPDSQLERKDALEGVWLFEQILLQLKRYLL